MAREPGQRRGLARAEEAAHHHETQPLHTSSPEETRFKA
jgi:hypothetical protein